MNRPRYFSVLVPYVEPEYSTEWHPTTSTGPFAVLTRGIFGTEGEAIKWARKHLEGTPYSIKRVEFEPGEG
jgi:hypothetical protein